MPPAVLCFMLLLVLFNGSFDRFFLANASEVVGSMWLLLLFCYDRKTMLKSSVGCGGQGFGRKMHKQGEVLVGSLFYCLG